MKRFLAGLIIGLAVGGGVVAAAATILTPSVIVDGRPIAASATPAAVYESNQLWLYSGAVSEPLGFTVSQSRDGNTVTLRTWRDRLRDYGFVVLLVDGKSPSLDLAAISAGMGDVDGVWLDMGKYSLVSPAGAFRDYVSGKVDGNGLIAVSTTLQPVASAGGTGTQAPATNVVVCDSTRKQVELERGQQLAQARREFASRGTLRSSAYTQEVDRIDSNWDGVLQQNGCK